MEPTRYETSGGVVVRDGAVLLLRRSDPPEVRLPKGHIDPGETPQEAALREVLEESGYRCEIVDELDPAVVRFDRYGIPVERTEHYFVMRALEHQHDGEEAFLAEWIPIASAEALLTFEAEQARIREVAGREPEEEVEPS